VGKGARVLAALRRLPEEDRARDPGGRAGPRPLTPAGIAQAPQHRYTRLASQRKRADHPVASENSLPDKDDCADMVVTMCRTETMTGHTIVVASGRCFH
jgi:hypothetical protein